MGVIADLNVRLGMQVKKFNRDVRGVEFKLNKLARTTAKTGQSLTTNLTLPLVAAGVAGIKMASDFEFSMTKIQSQVGIAADEVANMRTEVLKLSGRTAQAPKDLADAMFFIQSAGLRGATATQALEQSAMSAAAGFGPASTVADLLTSSINAYGSETLNAAQANDILAATVREGKASAESLTGAMGSALPIASNMGIKFHELGGAIAAMTRTGTSADGAVTQLNAIMSTFLKPSEGAVKIANRLGVSFEELRTRIKEKGLLTVLTELQEGMKNNGIQSAEFFTNVRALKGVMDLTGASLEENEKIMDRMAKTTGTANQAFEIAAQTSQFKFKKALSELQVASIDLGASLLPMATKLVTAISDLASKFTGLSDSNKKLAVSAGIMLAAVGPAFTVFSRLTIVYRTLKTSIMGVREGLRLAKIAFTETMISAKGGAAGMVNFTQVMRSAKAAFLALNAVSKAAVIGLVVAGIAAAVAIYKQFNKEVSLSGEVALEASKSIAGQRKKVELLTAAIQNEKSSLDEKEKALNSLKGISKEYFGQLTLEEGRVRGLTAATNGYIAAILKQAKARAAASKLEELATRQIELREELKTLAGDTGVTKFIKEFGIGLQMGGNRTVQLVNALKTLEDQMNTLSKIELDNTAMGQGGGTFTASNVGGGSGSGGMSGGTQSTSGGGTVAEQARELLTAVDPLPTKLSEVSQTTQIMNAALEKTKGLITPITEGFSGWGAVLVNVGKHMQQTAMQGVSSLKTLGKAALKSAADQVRANIMAGVSRAIANAIGTGPFGLLLAAGAGAAAGAIFNKALKAVKIPAFAKGVTNFSGGPALVGEEGPEMVTLPRGANVIPNHKLGGMGGTQVMIPSITLKGEDMVLSFERTQNRLNRFR